MNDAAFMKLVRQTAAVASEHHKLMNKVGEEFVRRYGVTYSDCDAEDLIDALDYGVIHPPRTIAAIDAEMAASGHPRKEQER